MKQITINNVTYYRYKTQRTTYFLSSKNDPDYQYYTYSITGSKIPTPLPFSIDLLRKKSAGII